MKEFSEINKYDFDIEIQNETKGIDDSCVLNIKENLNVHVLGINYKTAPVEVREKLSFTKTLQKEILDKVKNIKDVLECVLLCTCNRTEIYVYTENPHFKSESIEEFFYFCDGLDISDLKKYFYFYLGLNGVEHLFKVASGLDSQVLGECEILGQVKQAHTLAMEMGSSSVVFNTLFREAITCAKKVRTCTAISQSSISVGSLATKMVGNFYNGELSNKKALIIGTGETGNLVLTHLISEGIGDIYITNRTHGKALELSNIHKNVHVVLYNQRYSVVEESDIIISATQSPHYTITKDTFLSNLKTHKERIVIDMAIPRDIDKRIGEIEGIHCFNMDDIKTSIDNNFDKRMLEIPKAYEIIRLCVLNFKEWYQLKDIYPVFKNIKDYLDGVVTKGMEEVFSKVQLSNDTDRELITGAVNRIVNDIMNKFVYDIKGCSDTHDINTYFKCIKKVIEGTVDKSQE